METEGRVRVLVVAPLVGRDAPLVAGWAAGVAAVAAAHPSVAFETRAAVRAGDVAALGACRLAGVAVAEVPWYALPASGKNEAGVTLMRIRLVREALAAGAAVVWFVNADVRVGPGAWAGADAVLRGGWPAAVVPYPARWAAGVPAVAVRGAGGAVAVVDARQLAGAPVATVLAGSLGCAAILTQVAAAVPFVAAPAGAAPAGAAPGEAAPGEAAGLDVGWFVGAARAGAKVGVPLGVLAEHVGCPLAPRAQNPRENH